MAGVLATAHPPAAMADGPSYVTIMFSRAQVEGVTSPNCTPMPNSVPIWQVAQDLAAQGYPATEAVSTSLEADTGETCNTNGDLTLSWDDLRQLQSQYGWDAIPRGNQDDRSATAAQQYADSCALLPTFYGEGFANAWSMYAYFGGPYSASMQSGVVSTCFGFGRTYNSGANALPVPSPYLVQVFSINGGHCNDVTLPCHANSTPYPYTMPSTLQALVQSNGWDVIQGYKFVTGAYSSSAVSWDCTGADPASHWTSRSEVYCYNDWQSVIDAIPATAQVVAPSAVAGATGRAVNGPLATISLTPSQATIAAGGSQRFQVEGFDDQGHDLGTVLAQTSFSIDGTGSCAGSTCSATDTGSYTVTATSGGATATAQLTVVDPPLVSGIAPASGRVGDTVTITGSGLDAVAGVAFNGTAAVPASVSPTQLTVAVPNGATDGPVTLTALGGVTEPAGSFAVQPSISGFSPQAAAAGTTVTISGSALAGASAVTIAGVPAPFTVSSYASIKATVPVIAAPGPISVTTPDGSDTSTASFGMAPAITGLTPTSGKVGSLVTITGSGLKTASAVRFNGAAAAFTAGSDTTITATVPGAASTGKVTVTVAGVVYKSAVNFNVVPTISGFSPTSGKVGAAVTISGSGFTHATKVLFGGVAASYGVLSATQIKATVPAGAPSAKITVRTAGGAATSAVKFTVLAGAHAAGLHR
ncbi:MAG: hypothetical protein QOI17_443 [Gaiellales bacterium]|jgi:hypothetical protein|nr:hypothetical protein [Gaiellales bacterium]